MSRQIVYRVSIITILCVACAYVLLPLFRHGFPVTDDGDWMIIRLSAFYQSFREGQFPVRFLGRLNYSYGYPVANFLYPGFLYIGSFLHALGLPFSMAIKIILGGSVITGAVATYFWLRHFFDETASALGTVSFLFMPYLLFDIYTRGSVGEVLAVACCMVAFWAIEDKRKWIVSPVIALLAISHNTLAIFFLGALFFYICVRRCWNMIGPFILGSVMSAFFWLPALFDQNIVMFQKVVVSDPAHYFRSGELLIVKGFPLLIATVLAILFNRRSNGKERWYFVFLLAGSALLATGVTGIIWKITQFARVIQFPYRFLAFWSFTGPWLIADIASAKKRQPYRVFGLLAIIPLLVLTVPYQKIQSIIRSEGFYTTNEATTTVANEYMPRWASIIPTRRADRRLEMYAGNARVDERLVTTDTIDITIHAKEESGLQINTIYFPGWGVMIDDKPAVISYSNPAGLMRITIPAGDHRVYMAFRESAGHFIADVISLGALVMYVGLYFIPDIVIQVTGRNKT